MKKVLALVLSLVLVVGVVATLAACGGKEDAQNNDEPKKDTIVVGYTIYEPMNYMEDGKLTGFDTEFAEAVCAKLGLNINNRKIIANKLNFIFIFVYIWAFIFINKCSK